MKYLLDTNICIGIINGKDPSLRERLRSRPKNEVVICSIVKAELSYGVKKSCQRTQNEQRLSVFLREFKSLPFDDECAEHYGTLRALLEPAGIVIGANGLLIAAITQRHRLTLITRNLREFGSIPSLQVEAW